MKKLIAILSALSSLNAFAVDMREVSLWKGFSQNEQNANLIECQRQLRDLQICSVNMFEHKHAAYDVALMEAVSEPSKTVALYKGYNQTEQNQNQAECQKAAKFGQLCVTNAWIHKAAVYDVALME